MKLFVFRSSMEMENLAFRFYNLKVGAKRRGKVFTLTMEHLRNILRQTHCAYSGLPFGEVDSPEGLSLERIDCDKGYEPGNVVPVMKKFNIFRSDMNLDDLRKMRSDYIMSGASKQIQKIKSYVDGQTAQLMASIETKTAKLECKKLRLQSVVLSFDRAQRNGAGSRRMAGITLEKDRLNVSIKRDKEELDKLKVELSEHVSIRDAALLTFNTDQDKLNAIDTLIAALSRYNNLSSAQKERLSLGIPVDASATKLIMAKMGF